jgi:hypothetical protein
MFPTCCGSGFVGSFCFGPPGSGSLYHHAKIVKKTLIPTVLWLLYDFLSLKNDVNIPSKSNKQKNFRNTGSPPFWAGWRRSHPSRPPDLSARTWWKPLCRTFSLCDNPTKIYIITDISESIILYWRCPSMVLGSNFQASCPVSQDMMEAYV